MSEKETDFMLEFKRQVIAVAVFYAFALLLSVIGFYYTTENKTSNNAKDIERIQLETAKIKYDIEVIKAEKIEKQDYIREVTSLKDAIKELTNKIDRIK